jgi:S1-C subfamily serine protease
MSVNVRSPFVICCLGTLLFVAVVSQGAEQNENSAEWASSAMIMRNGQRSGAGIYLKSGLVITAAHLTALDAEMSVRFGREALPAKVLKQGSLQDVDLSLLLIDEEKLPSAVRASVTPLCEAPAWPGDPVIVVDAGTITRSHIIAPELLPLRWRTKFSTLIGDVATTGNSGSGVFDANRTCLLGIMSQKFTAHTAAGDKDVAKYFVPANVIREFISAESTPKRANSSPQ